MIRRPYCRCRQAPRPVATTATLTVTTDEGNGTLYAVAVASADSAPSATQIRAGQNAAGSAAPYAGNQAVVATGVKTFSATGLTAATAYKAYYAQQDAVGNNSAASAASSTFTTDAGVPAWVLSGFDIDLDFVNNRYWNGTAEVALSTLLTTDTSYHLDANGLTPDASTNHVLPVMH
jgi:hypothetical protein